MKNTLFLLTLLNCLLVNSQNKVGYYYDNNGNRYQRYHIGFRAASNDTTTALDSILNAPSPDIAQNAATLPKAPQTIAAEQGITVYPNPTRDLIMVNITRAGEKESKKANMFLIDNNGRIIDTKNYSGKEISFDLSKNPPGNYYLKVIFEDQTKLNYKVVKVN